MNEIDAKGVGEIGITGAGAAIAGAVYHATASGFATADHAHQSAFDTRRRPRSVASIL
jgi:CO/xanthine dehydrogenase Mo-binding subunit